MSKEVEIILIEDNEQDAELAIRALKKYNFVNNVIWLKDGAEAIKFFDEHYKNSDKSDLPKLILLDLKLPKVNGIELLQKIKKDETFRLIPVVVLTSSNEETDIIKTYDLGVNSYIVKPVDFGQFVESVREIGMYWILMNKTI